MFDSFGIKTNNFISAKFIDYNDGEELKNNDFLHRTMTNNMNYYNINKKIEKFKKYFMNLCIIYVYIFMKI